MNYKKNSADFGYKIIIKQVWGSHLRITWKLECAPCHRHVDWKPYLCSCAVSNVNSIVIVVNHSTYLMPINVKYFLLVAKIVVWNADRISYKNSWQDRVFRKIKSDWLSDVGPESFKWDGGRFDQLLPRSFDKKLRTYSVTIRLWLIYGWIKKLCDSYFANNTNGFYICY